MARLEFLLEEASMEAALRILLPKILPPQWELDVNVFLRPHEGKSDLKNSIPKKIRAFSHHAHEPVGVIILHDQDSADCKDLKAKLLSLCQQNLPTPPPHLVRIVCRHLEAWYLGDMIAIEKAYPAFKATRYQNKEKFRQPDSCNAWDELNRILPGLGKVSSARNITPHLDLQRNRSESFNQFITGLTRFTGQFFED